MTGAGKSTPGDASRIICNLQRARPASARQSGNRLTRSSPGQTTTRAASTTPRPVTTRGGSTAWTTV
ncbi:hypothetical protein ER13_16670 [Brevundimonas sp. EAKA]|nr:hypothetical protein ER13_16670 [Brevundimonas sp. EAKA]